jgi:hypothetical protein
MSTKKVYCNLIQPGVPTRNGRIYSEEAVKKLVDMTNEQAKDGHCLVVREPGPYGQVSLNKTVGLVRDAKLESEKMVCTIEMLSVPDAAPLIKMIDMGVAAIAPLAYGTEGPDGKVDPASLRIHGWSFVDNHPKDSDD